MIEVVVALAALGAFFTSYNVSKIIDRTVGLTPAKLPDFLPWGKISFIAYICRLHSHEREHEYRGYYFETMKRDGF